MIIQLQMDISLIVKIIIIPNPISVFSNISSIVSHQGLKTFSASVLSNNVLRTSPSNAIEAIAGDGMIKIRIEQIEQMVQIEIADDGPGFGNQDPVASVSRHSC